MQLVPQHVRDKEARQKEKEALKSGHHIEEAPQKKKSCRAPSRIMSLVEPAEETEYPLPLPEGGKEYSKDKVVEIVGDVEK